MEEMVVIGKRRPTTYSLDIFFWQTPRVFFTEEWIAINRQWSKDQYDLQVPSAQHCIMFKLLSSHSSQIPEDLRQLVGDLFETNLASNFVGVDDPNDTRLGWYQHVDIDQNGIASPNDEGIIHIHTPNVLRDSHKYNLYPSATILQASLHEWIHAARIQNHRVSLTRSDSWIEERTVQELTYRLFKAMYDNLEPPMGFRKRSEIGAGDRTSPVNEDYDRIRHAIAKEDLCW